ncbi:hypothetical protein GC175_30430 [bacterium]|nr:hypothetical protein [bacterium]
MNAVAERFADQNVGSIFVYSYEAHPGEFYLHLTSMAQKFRHAADLRDKLGVNRPILVDALDGACHRAYGSMPNMTWIFNRSGIPIYKSDWTDANSVENAIVYFLEVIERRRSGVRMTPFRVERLDYRINDREEFYRGLERNGPKAVEEFREAFG